MELKHFDDEYEDFDLLQDAEEFAERWAAGDVDLVCSGGARRLSRHHNQLTESGESIIAVPRQDIESAGTFFDSNLNASQLKAVSHDADILLILAGPGSGKTRVLTARMAHFVLERGYQPSRIRGVTFSRAATAEMQKRLKVMSVKGVRITTLHGLARDIVKSFHTELPALVSICRSARVPAPTCFVDWTDANASDEDSSNSPASKRLPLLGERNGKQVRLDPTLGIRLAFGHVVNCIQQGLDLEFEWQRAFAVESTFDPSDAEEDAQNGLPFEARLALERYISLSRLKKYVNDAIGKSIQASVEAEDMGRLWVAVGDFLEHHGVKRQDFLEYVYEVYFKVMYASALLDYTDQQIFAHQILASSTRALKNGQAMQDALFVDEFQDTDPVQYEIIRLLSDYGKIPLTVVGDPNQAIYGFRGADMDGILSFRRVYPCSTQVSLDINYRSTREIVDASYSVVKELQDPT